MTSLTLTDSFGKLNISSSEPSLEIGKSYYLDNKSYKILKYLSYGAFKHVYIAEDKHDKKKVIIAENKSQKHAQLKEVHVFKRLKRELTKDGKFICNPRIICPIAIIENGKYILTNYFEGSDLFELIDQSIKNSQFIPLDIVKNIMLNCAIALRDLHTDLHFIHLDIKPENIMYDMEYGQIGLIDLGEGCFDDNLEKCTLHRYKSTIGYISPEIMFDWEYIEYNPDILRASDIYSLGCVFYELLYSRKVYGWIEDTYDTNDGKFIDVLMYVLDKIDFTELYQVNKIRDADQLRHYCNRYDINTKERSIDVQFEEFEDYSLFQILDEMVDKMLDPDYETRISLNEIIAKLTAVSSPLPSSASSVSSASSLLSLSSSDEKSLYTALSGPSSPRSLSGGMNREDKEINLFKAIEEENLEKISNLISLNPINLYEFHKDGDYKFTPIEWAVKLNCIKCVDTLLKGYELYKMDTIIRFNTNIRSLGQPIHLAIENGNLDMINYLIENDFNVNKLNKMGFSPLHLAIKKNRINLFYFLLRQPQIDKMKLDKNGRTPLEFALELHHFQIANMIIRSMGGKNINMTFLNKKFKNDSLVLDFLKAIALKLSRKSKTQMRRKDKLERILIYDELCRNLNEALTDEIISVINMPTSKDEFCENLLKSIFFENVYKDE